MKNPRALAVALLVVPWLLVGSLLGGRQVLAVPAGTLVVGAQANAWNNAAVGINGTSTAIQVTYTAHCSIFGNVSGASNITYQFSQDGTNFYDHPTAVVVAGAGNFADSRDVSASYLRLKSSTAVTITATIACKQ